MFNASGVATSALMPHWECCRQLDKAMIHSSHQYRKTKAIAEALAMLDDAHPELDPHRPSPVREIDDQLWESATEFCAALGRTMEIKRTSAPTARRPRAQRGTHPNLKLV